MLRGKAIKVQKGEVRAAEKFLASTDAPGQIRWHPDCGAGGQCGEHSSFGRGVMEKPARRRQGRVDPVAATKKFRSQAKAAPKTALRQRTANAPRQGRNLSTCYVNYNEPGIGMDLLAVLAHNDIPYEIVNKEKCCGMPKLELGDLLMASRNSRRSICRCSRNTRVTATRSSPRFHPAR